MADGYHLRLSQCNIPPMAVKDLTGLSPRGFMMRSPSVIFLYVAKPVFCICGAGNGGTMTQVNQFIVLGIQ